MSAIRYSWAIGPSVGPARAAVGSFPFPHRTVAEIEAEIAERRAFAASVPKGPGADDWEARLGGSKDVASNRQRLAA